MCVALKQNIFLIVINFLIIFYQFKYVRKYLKLFPLIKKIEYVFMFVCWLSFHSCFTLFAILNCIKIDEKLLLNIEFIAGIIWIAIWLVGGFFQIILNIF